MNYQRNIEDLSAVIRHAKLDDKNLTKVSQVSGIYLISTN